ncbi:hypothetical protein EJ02DRAFT_470614 [Clathrospora elynae]|uniref:Uncharacterized protein n=1 Tax=Clathrospora elynae TaxID=706981 RepID=A0A6A5SFN4_9PLEO|nr:hypothetical protein EJ02DRAFT_470614 [Clathrospora elynae]
MSVQSSAEQYAKTVSRFKDEGLNEACNAWADFFKLRCADCPTSVKFTDKFGATLSKLRDMQLGLPDKGVIYQFILAIEDIYQDYARVIRRDMRSRGVLTLDDMIKEICKQPVLSVTEVLAAAAASDCTGNTCSQQGSACSQ